MPTLSKMLKIFVAQILRRKCVLFLLHRLLKSNPIIHVAVRTSMLHTRAPKTFYLLGLDTTFSVL